MIGDSFDSLIRKTNSELGANKLPLDISKSQYSMFRRNYYNNSSALRVRGQVLPQCSHTKLLGIAIDENLSFSAQITTVCNKISRNIGFINKLSHFISKKTLRCLYCSHIYPHLTNAIETWGNSSKTKLSILRRLLDRFLKILRKSGNDSRNHGFKLCALNETYQFFAFIWNSKYYSSGLGNSIRHDFSMNQF